MATSRKRTKVFWDTPAGAMPLGYMVSGGQAPPNEAATMWDPFGTSDLPVSGSETYKFGIDPTSHVDPTQQTGAQQAANRYADFFYNTPGRVANALVGKSLGNDLGIDLATKAGNWMKGIVEPVASNANDWFTKTGPEYEASRRRRVQATTPATPSAFSPTGETRGPNPTLAYISQRESSGNPNATNPNSSASGEHQFLTQTWLSVLKRHGPAEIAQQIQQDKSGKYYVPDARAQVAILNMRFDPKIEGPMTQAHVQQDLVPALTKSLGREPTTPEVYLAWHFGEGAAATMIKAPQDASVGGVISPDAIKANPRVFPNGAQTTIGQVRTILAGNGSGGTGVGPGRIIAQQTTQLPGSPPEQQPVVPADFSRAEAILAGMKPQGVDEAYVNKQRKNLLLAGWTQGVTSREGGIPGMLARMAAGGFQAGAQGDELRHQLGEQADKENRQWQGQNYQLELTKAERRAEEANANSKIGFQNKSGEWDYKLKLASLARMDVSPMGTIETTTVNPQGQLVKSVSDIGSEITAFRLANGLPVSGRSGGTGANGLPTDVENRIKMYSWARQRTEAGAPGGDAVFFGALADEIADSPYKSDIIGGDAKRYQAEIMKRAAMNGGNTKAAEVNYIVELMSEGARRDPKAMADMMTRAAGHGLVGPLMMRQ